MARDFRHPPARRLHDRALEDLNAGFEKSPDLVMCHFARGDIYFHKGEYQKAVDDYTDGLKQAPNIEALVGAQKPTSDSVIMKRR